ncbi:unnamed protein product [Caenorhabditis auriculariae]|uniref:Uncharacterized protein n=1 Tax=Caenorhabditis auriculariae TaxID=2777116 RepID=A0A8S1HC95_9PELO|nr:unnamed protein product [Caenorhabditis auriculariae]
MSVRLDLEAVPLIDLTARPSEEKIPIKFENDTLNQDVARSVIQQTARDGKMSEAFHTALSQHPEAVNVADHLDGMTAVHFAAKYGHIDVLKVLFRFHGDVAVQNFEGDTPLHLVAKYCRRGLDGRTNITSQIIRMLVGQQTTNSKDKSYINCKDKFKLTALHYAAMKSNVQAAVTLISLGATVTETDSNDVTPLLLACVHGTKEVIEKLINAGSDLTKKDQRQNTVYHIVALRGEPEILRMLLQRAGKDGWSSLLLRNNEGKTPLRMAVEGNHPQTLKEILEIEQKNGTDWKTREKGLLHLAAGRGYLQVISELVQAGASKTEVDSRRQIPLHLAAKSNQKEVVEYLLEKETIDAVDDFGMTPLMVACAHDSIDALKILIESGANVWVFDNDDRTCVFVGAKYNALKTVDYILTYLKQQAAAKVGNEPAGKFFKTLRRVDTSGETSMVNMTDSDQSTPMHVVASNGYIEMMRLLYDHGAIISAVNEDEETPLHRAASVGETGAVRQLLEWDRRLILLKDDMGNSPLHLAAKRERHETWIRLLHEPVDMKTVLYSSKWRRQLAEGRPKQAICPVAAAASFAVSSSKIRPYLLWKPTPVIARICIYFCRGACFIKVLRRPVNLVRLHLSSD